jgi:DNA-binding transcriptional MocR family regulator
MATPSLTQFSVTPDVIDLSWGMPDPTLLPVEQLRTAANRALDRYGPAALAYGLPQGPAPLIEFITNRLAQTDARPPTPQEVLVTSGASQGLDLAADLILEPGDTALVDVPTYHLALHIFRDHPINLVQVASDADGVRAAVSSSTRPPLAPFRFAFSMYSPADLTGAASRLAAAMTVGHAIRS